VLQEAVAGMNVAHFGTLLTEWCAQSLTVALIFIVLRITLFLASDLANQDCHVGTVTVNFFILSTGRLAVRGLCVWMLVARTLIHILVLQSVRRAPRV